MTVTEAARAAAERPSGLSGQSAVDDLVALLDLERIEENIFRGVSPAESPVRVFGGQVAGQALVAAGRTVPVERRVHSLHSYFIRPGDPRVPIVYEVDRIRDGRSFTTRRVVAVQHGKAIFALSASFQLEEQGIEHSAAMPAVPDPETLPTWAEQAEGYLLHSSKFPRPIDVRYVTEPPWESREDGPGEPASRVWMKADGKLPDDPMLHICVMTYASDMTLLDGVLAKHGVYWGLDKVLGASLDHAMWFHRPFRADEWLLYDTASPSSSGNRGLATGQFFTQDGQLVATVVQEGLIRVLKSSPDGE
ncbi:acyl-CoA thioesterase [Nocardia sp. NRRL S-836]|nr:acyl-CoA thioesterase [Nocardia sp. NRRL S-836]